MERSYYEEIAGTLHGLLIRIEDRLSLQDATLVTEYIDANELGLALEGMAYALSEEQRPVTAGERADMLALSERMEMGDGVAEALRLCPSAG